MIFSISRLSSLDNARWVLPHLKVLSKINLEFRYAIGFSHASYKGIPNLKPLIMRTVILLILIPFCAFSQRTQILKATQATIYEEGTTVTRSGKLQLNNGLNKIVIDQLPIDLDESTLSVLIGGDAYIQTKQISRIYNTLSQILGNMKMSN